MALRVRKKSAETCKSTGASRNSSPTYSLIKHSLVEGLKEFTKTTRSKLLTQSELKSFLVKVKFLKKTESSEDDLKDFLYMWNLVSRNSLVHISDAFAYVLVVLDIEIPKSILKSGVVFKEIVTDLQFVKINSTAFNRNYLADLYELSKGKQFCFRVRTPKSWEDSFRVLESKKKENLPRRRGSKEIRPPSCLKNNRVRLKRSGSNSRNNSREIFGVLATSENKKSAGFDLMALKK